MQAAGLLHPPGQAPDAPGVPWRSHTREPLPDHIGVRWGSPSHTSGLLQRPKCWPWKCPEAVSPPTALSAGRVGQVHSRRLSRGPCHAPSEHHPRHSGASGCGFSLFCRLWQGSICGEELEHLVLHPVPLPPAGPQPERWHLPPVPFASRLTRGGNALR